MAGKQLKENATVRASTVLEVIIAMTVIVVVFGIAMMIYGNVMRMSLSVAQLKAKGILKEQMLKAERADTLQNASFQIDSLTIEQNVSDTLATGLKIIHLKAYDINHQKVAELQKIITDE